MFNKMKGEKMKRMMILLTFQFISIFITGNFLYAYFSETTGGGKTECCSASSLLGSSCTANCLPGECCRCEGGLFTARCECYNCSQSPSLLRSLPQISQKQRQDAIDFANWCQGQTPGIQSLKPIVLSILNAIDIQDQEAYSIYEKQFRDTFVSLTQSEQDACNQWATERGY